MVGGADMTSVVWEMTHSEDADADVEFVWKYWSDVGNWDDPPATFELEGAFAAGARGWTRIPGQATIAWFVREVTPGEGATIEIPADGAAMCFSWRFESVGVGRTRITQHVSLRGEKAENYLGFAKTFEANLPAGMTKLAAAIEKRSKK
jgi:hypothetical protein